MARAKNQKPKKQFKRAEAASPRVSVSADRWLWPIAVFVLTGIAFLPSLQNGFVDWDDNKTIIENPHFRGLSWTQLRWMFTTLHMGHYQPLSWMTLGADYLLWEMNPFGYHLTSLLFHCANALLFYFITLRLLRLAPASDSSAENLVVRGAAGFSALLFAIHPLRVESVAWITERRDVVSGLFFLLTLFCYLKGALADTTEPRWWMASAVIVYCLSLLSKAAGITLPVVLVILDIYPLRRVEIASGAWRSPPALRVWREKIPFLLLAMIFAATALLAQSNSGALRSLTDYSAARRFAQAFYGITFYLWKTLIPINLSPIYGTPVHLNAAAWRPLILSATITLAVTVVLITARNRWPASLATWIYYLALLAPVLGFAQSGPQIVADRYTYLSCLGWAALCGAALFHLWLFCSRENSRNPYLIFPAVLAAAIVAALGALSWKQTEVWRDGETLWTNAVSAAPQDPWTHNFFANALVHRGKVKEGIEEYLKALQIEPDFKEAHHNLAITLATQGQLKEAIEHYHDALRIDSGYKEAHNNLGVALASRGQLTEAIEEFRQALRIDPAFKDAANNLRVLLPEENPN